MTKKIDNFTISETTDKVVVDYNKTLKDWFDILITLAMGLFFSVATYLLLKQGFKTTSYIVVAGGLVFAFQAVVQSASGVSRLLQPTKSLLIIDRNSMALLVKQNLFTSKTFSLEEIQILVISGQNEKIFVGGTNQMTRTFCTISAKFKDNAEEQLFVINTNRFISPSSRKLETELYSQAKRLTTELNNHLKLKYKWTGYTDS